MEGQKQQKRYRQCVWMLLLLIALTTCTSFYILYKGRLNADKNVTAGTSAQGETNPLAFQRATKKTAKQRDSTPHTISFITVEKDVKLEVIDWGGTGEAMVFLTGLGNDAHIFDTFAPKFAAKYHVYGVTRRGFGASSSPIPITANYTADRLGDDVLAVIDTLKLDRPILVGHSIAGEELSSIGSRHPEKVAALIYLDAAYPYAYYNCAQGDLIIDAFDFKKKIDQLLPGSGSAPNAAIQDLLASLPALEKDLRQQLKAVAALPEPPRAPSSSFGPMQAIMTGAQKFTAIPVPVLAIYAEPHAMGDAYKDNPSARAAMIATDTEKTETQAKAFESGVPTAHVVRIPNADHYMFKTNEVDVLREMNDFLAKLAN
jgi:non-heme chloroperoxidase